MKLGKNERRVLRKLSRPRRGMLHFDSLARLADKGLVSIDGEDSQDIDIKITDAGHKWLTDNPVPN